MSLHPVAHSMFQHMYTTRKVMQELAGEEDPSNPLVSQEMIHVCIVIASSGDRQQPKRSTSQRASVTSLPAARIAAASRKLSLMLAQTPAGGGCAAGTSSAAHIGPLRARARCQDGASNCRPAAGACERKKNRILKCHVGRERHDVNRGHTRQKRETRRHGSTHPHTGYK